MIGSLLPDLDTCISDYASHGRRTGGADLLGFELRGILYAFPASSVARVSPMPELSPLPLSPSWLAGLVSCRGETAAVLDLSELLTGDRSSPGPEFRLAILKGPPGHIPWAFFGREMREFSLPASADAPEPDRRGLHLFKTYSVGHLQITVLDPDAILASLNIE